MKRTASVMTIILALVFTCLAGTRFVNVAEANPLPAPPILEIYIRSDGTIDPPTVAIQREGNIYTFTSDLTNSTITVEHDNIVIDGAGYKLQGNGEFWNTGITLTNRSNVIIKNVNIRNYVWSISLTKSSNIIIYSNDMLTGWNILLDSSVDNQITGNNITGQDTGFGYCITFEYGSSNNLIIGNSFYDAGVAVHRNNGKNNTFYHNNFVNNSNNVGGWIGDKTGNFWDNGTEGNFWSDYKGSDANRDGIGDTPYLIDDVRTDRHPLMTPFNVSSINVEMPKWANPPDSTDSFPTVTIAAASVASVAVVCVGLLVYFKKQKR